MSINANAATLRVERSAQGVERTLLPRYRLFNAHTTRISPAALATVLAAHAAAWLGLSGYAAETQPPLERPILISLVTPATESPKTAPPLAPPKISKPLSRPVEKAVARMPVETARPRPLPEPLLAVPAATPQEVPPTATEAVPQAEDTPQDAPPQHDMPQAVVAAPQPAPIELPRFNADYLDNPAPAYPSLSRRLGEEGRVLLRVQVNAAGAPTQVLLQQSSGHARLDEVASATVRRWQFLPARQGGRPVEAWVTVPIKFSLKG